MREPMTLAVLMGSTREGRLCEAVTRWVIDEVARTERYRVDVIDPLTLELPVRQGADDSQSQQALQRRIAAADAVITTASIPGRPSPKIISKAMVESMKSGAVIVDLAAEGGGNCELSEPGKTTTVGEVTIVAPLNVPSMLAEHASEMYARNLLNLMELFIKEGELTLDLEDDVIKGALLTHDGEIVNEQAKQILEGSK